MLISADLLFQIVNQLALAGWILLIGFPGWKGTRLLVLNGSLSLIMSAVYLLLILIFLPEMKGGFGSLQEVALLFTHPYALLAGWVHYLAFDLFIGAWIVNNAREHRLKHPYLVPLLLLTFLFGPIGLLLYFALRQGVLARRRQTT